MTFRAAATALLFACAPAANASAQAGPEVAAIQLPESLEITDVLAVDVDNDGRSDLVIACVDRAAHRRELRLHLGAAGTPAFRAEPSLAPYVVERDAIAFAYADVDARPGLELVLFTAERAVAVLLGDGTGPIYTPLFAHRLVWQAPDRDEVQALRLVVQDVDGDGLHDFVLPEPDGARVLLQRRDDGSVSWAPPRVWTQPVRQNPVAMAGGGPARVGRAELRLSFDIGGRAKPDDFDQRPLVSVRTRAALTMLIDFDGDGVRDGIAARNDTLWWWQNAAGGKLATTATALPMPMPPDRLALFDPAFDVQVTDIDGDRRADLLLTTSARRNDEVEVRIDLFLQRATNGPWASNPDGRLRLQTLARPPQLVDADGDGRLDLVAITVRTDLLGGITGGAPSSLEGQLNIYRGSGTRFQVPGMLVQQLQLPAPQGRQPETFAHVVPGTGGAPSALLLLADKHVQLRPLRRDGAQLRLEPPAWQLPIGGDARPRRAPAMQNECLVIDEHELLHVRWR